MRFLILFITFFIISPVRSFAQEEFCDYAEHGTCADANNLSTTETTRSSDWASAGGRGIVITEDTPIIGSMALQCFQVLSSQSALIQAACEQTAELAYQTCLESYDGIDPIGPDGRYVCGAPHTSALEYCAAVPDVLGELVTACSDEDSTILQLYPF